MGKVSKRYLRIIVPLILALSLLFPPAHAPGAVYIGFTGANNNINTCSQGTTPPLQDCELPPTSSYGIGTAILNPLTGSPAILISVSVAVSVAAPDRVVVATFPSGQNPTIVSSGFCNNNHVSSGCTTVQNSQTWTIVDVESLSGLSTSSSPGGSFQTVVLANPQTISANQWVAITFMQATANLAIVSCDVNCPSGPPNTSYAEIELNYNTGTPVKGGTGTTVQGFSLIVGGTFQPVGSSSGQTAITQCYGNCGTPAVTLVNTNSTHAFNFNQSITFFYEFQSNLNGFLLNITTSIAKTYTNQFVSLGVYEIASCAQGVTPFSGACPGLLLQSSQVGGNPLLKGKVSLGFANGQIAVQNGQWVGISVTATYSGLDLNDTNTNVGLFTTQGANPPAITASSLTSCACKMGLWAFITGNVVTGPGAITPTSACPSFATLDCILPFLVNGLCSNVTPQCQSSSALVWILGLTIVSELAIGMGFDRIRPGSQVPIGETFVLMLLIWTFIMTGLSLLFLWVPVFFFMIAALMFSKHTGRFF